MHRTLNLEVVRGDDGVAMERSGPERPMFTQDSEVDDYNI